LPGFPIGENGFESKNSKVIPSVVVEPTPTAVTSTVKEEVYSVTDKITSVSTQDILQAQETAEVEEDDYGNDFASAASILTGIDVQGKIEVAGDLDYFKFVPSVSGVYSIESTGTSNVSGYLYNSNRTQIVSDDNSGKSSNFYMVYSLTVGQTYYLRVNYYSSTGTGSYTIAVNSMPDDYGNDISTADSIGFDNEVQGEIQYACDMDYFKLNVTVEGSYIIESTGSTDTYGILFNSSGSLIATGTDISSTDKNFRIIVSLSANQTYYIRVSHNYYYDKDNAGTGIYGLKITGGSDDHGNGFDSATLVQIGSQTAGNIESIGDIDYFKFVAGSSGVYTIETTGSTNTYAYLYDSRRNLLVEDNNSGIGSNAYIVRMLNVGQTYYVRINNYNSNSTGAYGIIVTSVVDDYGNDISLASDISLGTDVAGEISYANDLDYFRFTTAAAGPYIIKSTGSTDMYGIICDENGSNIAYGSDISTTDKNFYLSVNLSANSTYYLRTSHQNYSDKDNSGFGAYVINVSAGTDDHGNTPELSSEIQPGVDVNGNIESAGDIDYFRIVPSQSGMYAIETTGTGNTYGTLYNSAKGLIKEDNNSGTGNNFYIASYLLKGETYYIRVYNYNNSTGTYILKANQVADDYSNDTSAAKAIQLDEELFGEITYVGDTDVFKFTTVSEGIYKFESTGTMDTYGVIKSSNGSSIASGSGAGPTDRNFSIYVSLSANQTYYLTVSQMSNNDRDSEAGGTYGVKVTSVADDHGNNFDSATLINIGDTAAGKHESAGDYDYFKVIPDKSGMYTVESTGSSNVYGYLYNSSKGLLQESNNNGIGTNFYIVNYLNAGQTYYIKVSNYNNTMGEYAVKVEEAVDDYGNDNASASAMQLGVDMQGEINYACDVDVFKFTPAADGSYIFESTGDTDTYGILYNSSGSSLASNYDASASNKNFYFAVSLTANQTYYLNVRHQNYSDKDTAGTGSYHARVTLGMDDHGNNFDNSTQIQVEDTVYGNMESSNDIDMFKFTPAVTGTYTIESSGNTDVYGYLYNNAQNYIAGNDNGGVGKNFYFVSTLTAGETYYLRIAYYPAANTGGYSFKISAVSDDHGNETNTATVIEAGVETSGIIDYAADVDMFKFTTTDAGIYVFESMGSTDTLGYLYTAGGSTLTSGSGSSLNLNFFLSYQLSANTTYYLKVSHQYYSDKDTAGTGEYTVKAYKHQDDYGDSFGSATQVEVGIELKGNFGHIGDADYITFIPTINGSYTIETAGTTDTYGYLYDSAQVQKAYDDNSAGGGNFRIKYELSAGERYYLKIIPYSSSSYGQYRLRIFMGADDFGNDINSSTAITVGAETSCTINYGGDMDFFKFSPSKNGIFNIKSTGATDTFGEIYDYTGAMIGFSDNTDDSDGNFNMTQSLQSGNTYYLKVRHADELKGIGPYVVRVIETGYQFGDDHGNSFNTATLVNEGEKIQGNINYPSDIDFVKFIPQKTGVYTIESTGSTNTYGYLYGNTQNAVSYNGSSGIGDNFYMAVQLTSGQEYYLKVYHQSSGGTGTYEIKINYTEDDYINDFTSTVVLQQGTDAEGEINYPCDIDVFKLTPSVTGPYIVESRGTTDTLGKLYNSLGGLVYSNDNQSSTNTNFHFVAVLTAGQTYYLKVSHKYDTDMDTAGTGKYTVSSVLDNEAPSVPAGLDAAATDTSVTLSWKASTDNTGVKGYEIYKNGIMIDTTTQTTWSDSGLSPNTNFKYRVKAFDEAGNISASSEEISVETVVDNIAPSAPSNLVMTACTGSTVTLGWSASSDNIKVVGYEIYRDGVKVGTAPVTGFTDTGLSAGKTYKYTVRAYDANNLSAPSNEIGVMPVMPEITDFLPSNGLTFGGPGSQRMYVYFKNSGNFAGSRAEFEYSTDGTEWTSMNSVKYGPYSQNSTTLYFYCDWSLSNVPTGTYSVRYSVYDAADNSASQTAIYMVDRTPPSIPANIITTPGAGVINLQWTPSPEADTMGYKVYRSDASEGLYSLIGSTSGRTGVTFTDSTVKAGLTYFYRISSVDRYNQESNKSSAVSVIAQADTVPPVILGIEPVDSTIIGKQVKVTVRAEDNLLLSSIKLQYSLNGSTDWVDIDTVNTKSNATFTWDLTSHDGNIFIRAVARDSAGNESDGSPVRTYVSDQQGPAQVTGLMATPSTTVITLRWNDVSNDDFAYFQVECKDSQNGSFVSLGKVENTLGMNVQGLAPDTTYWFRVAAYDRMGNRGIVSFEVEARTTPDKQAPVITRLEPKPGRFSKTLGLKGSASDNVGVGSFTFQTSYDKAVWSDLATFTPTEIKVSEDFSYSADLTLMDEGPLYVRAVAKDASGNVSNTSSTASYIEHRIDRTAPLKPSGFTASSTSGYITLAWTQGNEPDIAYYRVYRSESQNGAYTVLADKITYVSFHDRNTLSEKTYYYMLSAIDSAGNESQKAEVISGKLLPDTEKPTIISFNPGKDSRLPANPTVSVLVSDNYKLSKVTLEFSLAADAEGQWKAIESRNVNTASDAMVFKWNTSGLSSGVYKLRAIATDESGNISDPLSTAYEVNVDPPAVPFLTALAGGWKVDLSWTSGNEEDLDGFRVYRSTMKDSGFKMIKETESTSYTDAPLKPEQIYYYKVEAVDLYNNSNVSQVAAVTPEADDPYAPTAEAGIEMTAVIGVEAQFDGTLSKDNDRIASYFWDFGDGGTANTAQPVHTYAQEGIYTVKLTVADPSGNTATDTTKVLVYVEQQVGTLEVKVIDNATGAVIPGANVYVDFSDDTPKHYTTNGAGITDVFAVAGNYNISAYKTGYLPYEINTAIKQYQKASITIRLKKSELVVGELNVRRMNLEEIMEAGIDVQAPENQHVYKFAVQLVFEQKPLPVEFVYINGEGMIVGGKKHIVVDQDSKGTGSKKTADVFVIPNENPEVPPTIVYMMVDREATWLKEFFEVGLVFQNMADSQFVIKHSAVTLKLPNGISLAPTRETQSLTVNMGDIAGQEYREVKWIIRGDQKGSYNLEANFAGTLMPFDQPVTSTFKTEESFRVWGGDALLINVDAENAAYIGEEYYVQFRLTNVSDVPVYNVKTNFGDFSQPMPVHEVIVYDPYGNKTVVRNGIEEGVAYKISSASLQKNLPALQHGDSLGIDVLYPGESIYGTYKQVFNAPGDKDQVYYVLKKAFSTTCGGSTTEVPVLVSSVPSHVTKYIVKIIDLGAIWADPVDTTIGAHVIEKEALAVMGATKLSFDLEYNSLLLDQGTMGKGWYNNYETGLKELPDGTILVYWSPSAFTRFFREDTLKGQTYGTVGRDGTVEITDSNSNSEIKYYTKTIGMKDYVLKRNSDGTYVLACKNNNMYFFDSEGKLAKLQDSNGRYVTISKNSEGKLVIIEPVSGQRLEVSYNNSGLAESVADKAGRKVSFKYDANNCLTEIKDAMGKTSTYTYDRDGRVLSGTDGDGIRYFTNTYDEKGRIATQDDAVSGNGLTKFSYDDTSEYWRTIVTITDRNGNVRKHVNNRYGQLVRVEDELGNRSTYTYDADGNKTSITDPKGNTTLYTYDSRGNIITATDQEGLDTAMTYDSRNNLMTVKNAAGEMVINQYDPNNLLTSTTDQRGNQTRYEYNDKGQLLTKTVVGIGTASYTYEGGRVKTASDYLGNKTIFEYDEAGRVTGITDRKGKTTLYEYDANDNLTAETDPLGHRITYTYDSRHNKTSVKDERGNVTYFKYNGNGKLIEVTDPKGYKTKYEYDGEDRLIKTTDNEGNTHESVYDAAGRVVSTKDPLGNTTSYTYDSTGDILTKTEPGKGVTAYTYYKNGKVKSFKDAAGNITTYGYDIAWRVNKVTDAAGKSTTYVYDEQGNLLSETNPLNQAINYTYDNMGNMLTKTDAKGNVTTYAYNANGKLTGVTDALENKTQYMYDKEDRLVKVIDAKGNEKSVVYDDSGNLLSITDSLGNTISMEYDESGNRIKIKDAYGNIISNTVYDETDLPYIQEDALGNRVTSKYDSMRRLVEVIDALNRSTKYVYDKMSRLATVTDAAEGESKQAFDSDGNLKSITDPSGGTTKFAYDAGGRLISETTAIGSVKTYGYNSRNLISGMKNGRGQETAYTYDDAGRLISYSDPAGTVTYTYDANGNVLTVSDSTGKSTREYDSLNRVIKYTDFSGNEIGYSYDTVGNLIALTYPGGKIVRYEYDAANRLVKVTDWENMVTRYQYDKNGRLVKTTRPNGTVLTADFDAAGRLLEQKDVDAAGNIINLYNYTYDASGNVIVEKSSSETEPFYLRNAVMTYDKGNRLISYNGQAVKYDEDGNMIYGPLDGKMDSFTYDSRNRLIKAGDTTYIYDAENNRIASVKNGVRTDYINNPNTELSQLLIQKDSNGNQTFFVYGLGLIGQQEPDGTYRTFHFDLRGSTTAITGNDGNITDRFYYAPYGELVGRTGTTNTPFLYSGMYGVITDQNGLYYMRARYYNTDIKRFINQDILQGNITDSRSLNRYAYCNGNPVSLTDPFGLSPELTPSFIGHTILDVLGFVPGVGEVFDLINAGWYLAEGDYMNAALSAACMIPVIGSIAGQGIKWGGRAFRAADMAGNIAAYSGRALDYAKATGVKITQAVSRTAESWKNSRIARLFNGNAAKLENRLDSAADVTRLRHQATSGVDLVTTPGRTTTVLGSYGMDTRAIVSELGNVKSTDFGPREGGFNLLNVPESLYKGREKMFWEEFNRPWLDAAIARDDIILIATKPDFIVAGEIGPLVRGGDKGLELSGFGREMAYLFDNGYSFNPITNQMFRR
jgi:RHS repeat-associated protein